jgi:hypothetical protein
VSPSWRDGLTIAVQPDEVRVRRHRRGWKRRSDALVRVSVDAGGSVVAACLQAVGEALPAAQGRAFDARVVLSNHLVRYAVVRGAAELRDSAEREAAARHAMAATYGDMAGGWRVVLDASGASDDALAAAIDEALFTALSEQLTAAGARSLRIEPLFAFAMNRSLRSVTARTGWFAVVERGRIVMASLVNGELGALRGHRVRASAQAELPVLLEQGSLLENVDPGRSEVVVATEDEGLDLPDGGHPFHVRPVRLDLTAPGGLRMA